MVLNILKVNNPADVGILRAQSEHIPEMTDDVRELCTNMVETMFTSRGVGLAAPQVGRNLNIFVMRTTEGIRLDNRDHIVLINPQVKALTGDRHTEQEGCLSIPGLWGDVERFDGVLTEYWSLTGETVSNQFSSFQARIFQHEYDHLKGTLFVDRATKFYVPKK
jgi:peptide deformylase